MPMPTGRRRELAALIAIFAAFVLLARFGGSGLRRPPLPDAATPRLGEAPAWSLPTPEGEFRSLADHTNQVVLLNFWATWCAACREELPTLEILHQELGDEGLAIVGVNVDREDAKLAGRFAEQQGLSFSVVLDPEELVAGRHGVLGYPTTVVIDRTGWIVLSELGAWDWSHPDAVAWLRELLAQ
jgi:thiol-disulfide isomerase/thioredoxin